MQVGYNLTARALLGKYVPRKDGAVSFQRVLINRIETEAHGQQLPLSFGSTG